MPKIQQKTPTTPRSGTNTSTRTDTRTRKLFHWGVPEQEITDNQINAIYNDIELSINNVNQVISKEWEKIKVSVGSAVVDTVAPPHMGKSIPLKENKISKNGIKSEQLMVPP